jgi:hypothetical protein
VKSIQAEVGANLVTFLALREGESFRWAIPPNFRGMTLDGVYVKGGPRTFGDADFQPFEVSDHELGNLVRPL